MKQKIENKNHRSEQHSGNPVIFCLLTEFLCLFSISFLVSFAKYVNIPKKVQMDVVKNALLGNTMMKVTA